jgi:hypothetical protein
VGDTDRRDIQQRAEVEREAGAAWVVAAGGVDEQDVRRSREPAHRRLQQGPLAEREQARLVRRARLARHHRRRATRTRGRPCPLAGAAPAAAAAREADEDAADPRARLEPPQGRVERRQASRKR